MEGWMWINEEEVALALLVFPITSSNPTQHMGRTSQELVGFPGQEGCLKIK